ncbi:MAG: FAD dependent oxidoreductase [Lentisphaerae bacterium ADurb.BinA184]|nr:MAG: FAD dependent oxidoreductase [Lentisphaerae bacterium ADurb.BinA184]
MAAGVTLLHHAGAARAIVEGTSPDGVPCAAGVFVETKAGRRAVLARCVIDATGDGIVAAQSGVPWEQGDGLHPYAMACTKVFRMGNAFWPGNWPEEAAMEKVAKGLAAAVRQGDYDSPVITEQNRLLGYVRGRHWELPEHRHETLSVISRVLAVDPLDPFDLTRAEREGREQARQAVDVYRRHVPGFERAFLADTSAHLGVRSSRRLHGLATVTAEDAIRFRKHPDAIARSSWEIDVWPADSYTAPAVDRSTPEWRHRRDRLIAGEFFDIRYGCLVATGLDNLLMAGRCLSAEHLAQASLRIQQTCMATGEAAGVAAALSVRAGVPPRALDPLAVAAAVRADCAAVEPAFECLRNLPTAGRHGGASP